MRFERNVNDEVIVKLTPEGERMYTMNAVYRDKLNNDSVYSFQIWELMHIFAEAMTFGDTKQVFVDNKLVFPEPFDIFAGEPKNTPTELFFNVANRLEVVN